MRFTFDGMTCTTATLDLDPVEFTDCDDPTEIADGIREMLEDDGIDWDEDQINEAADALWDAIVARE